VHYSRIRRKDFAKEAIFEKRPYLEAGLLQTTTFRSSAARASVLTLNPILALGALGAEAIWLLHGPDNPTLRRLLWIRGSRKSGWRWKSRIAMSG
jgi:hypothetical protein